VIAAAALAPTRSSGSGNLGSNPHPLGRRWRGRGARRALVLASWRSTVGAGAGRRPGAARRALRAVALVLDLLRGAGSGGTSNALVTRSPAIAAAAALTGGRLEHAARCSPALTGGRLEHAARCSPATSPRSSGSSPRAAAASTSSPALARPWSSRAPCSRSWRSTGALVAGRRPSAARRWRTRAPGLRRPAGRFPGTVPGNWLAFTWGSPRAVAASGARPGACAGRRPGAAGAQAGRRGGSNLDQLAGSDAAVAPVLDVAHVLEAGKRAGRGGRRQPRELGEALQRGGGNRGGGGAGATGSTCVVAGRHARGSVSPRTTRDRGTRVVNGNQDPTRASIKTSVSSQRSVPTSTRGDASRRCRGASSKGVVAK